MSKETPQAATQSRARKPFITTKRSAGARRAVHDTKERQDALQKQHAADYKTAEKESAAEAKAEEKASAKSEAKK